MRTLGIDLASQAAKTAACLIDWNESPPTILTLEIGLTDKGIIDLADQLELRMAPGDLVGDAMAIDAPFGWPQPFTKFISRSPTGKREVLAWNPSERKRLSLSADRPPCPADARPLAFGRCSRQNRAAGDAMLGTPR